MTYSHLSRFTPDELIKLLLSQIQHAYKIFPTPNLTEGTKLAPPTLALIGDFEIRARFHEQPGAETDPRPNRP